MRLQVTRQVRIGGSKGENQIGFSPRAGLLRCGGAPYEGHSASSLRPINDHAVSQIVGAQRNGDTVAENHADAEFPHSAAQLCTHNTGVGFGFDLELASGVNVGNDTIELNVIVALARLVVIGFFSRFSFRQTSSRADAYYATAAQI